MKKLYLCLLLLLWFPVNVTAGIVNTKHNLSISGTGQVKALTEDKICIFCHVSHHSLPVAPLWNRNSSGAVYTPYTSSTAVATMGQPTGSSLLCLSCHDGTIALGEVVNGGPIQMNGGTTTMPAGPGLIGTNLSDDHPISFVFSSTISTQRGELVDPSTLTGAVKLDSTGQLQCTTCHDPHKDDFGKFLVMDNRASALCEICHVKANWTQSPHRNSIATWNGVGNNPWPGSLYDTVADNACRNCHVPHSAQHAERLLLQLNEEETCNNCHNGNVASNVLADFNKASAHPVFNSTGIHNPNEPVIVDQRHVECVDCHNPHAAGVSVGVPGISGVDFAGNIVSPITDQYQLCFRCHADSPNITPPRTARQFIQPNIRLQFNPSNASYHPVDAVGKNSNVPSLIPPLTTSSMITCTDCHGSDTGSNAPHGSNNAPILKLQYVTIDGTAENPTVYALCYSCHDRNSILGNQTFSEHNMHIVGENTPCNVCHHAHGVETVPKLINFDTNVVSPSGGVINFTSNGINSGSCTLVCHGENHAPETY